MFLLCVAGCSGGHGWLTKDKERFSFYFSSFSSRGLAHRPRRVQQKLDFVHARRREIVYHSSFAFLAFRRAWQGRTWTVRQTWALQRSLCSVIFCKALMRKIRTASARFRPELRKQLRAWKPHDLRESDFSLNLNYRSHDPVSEFNKMHGNAFA